MEPLLLKAGDVGELLGLGRSKVFAMLAAGELPVVRMGRSVRVPRAALERWIVERTLDASSRSQDEHPPYLAAATCGHTKPDAVPMPCVGPGMPESWHVRPHAGTSAREPRASDRHGAA